MKILIDKILNEEINYEDYSSDYENKCYNKNYKQYLDLDNQLSMTDFVSFIVSNKKLFFNEIHNIKDKYLYSSITHGLNHNIRVLLFAFYLAKKTNLNEEDFRIIMDACKYHDVGRINDLYDERHGLRSSEMIDKIVDDEIYNNKENLNVLKAIIEYHSIPDREIDKIYRKYKLNDLTRYKLLATILKDADGLDRVRLSINNKVFSDLNPRYLRLDESKELVKISHIINFMFVNDNVFRKTR